MYFIDHRSVFRKSAYFLTLFIVCLGEFRSKSLENLVLSQDSSTSNTAALSHFKSLWARCIIFMITLSMDVCSSKRSCTTSNKFYKNITDKMLNRCSTIRPLTLLRSYSARESSTICALVMAMPTNCK